MWKSPVCTVKGERPVVESNLNKRHPPQSENQKLWGGRGVGKGSLQNVWAAGHLPVYGCGAEHEWSMKKNGVGKVGGR